MPPVMPTAWISNQDDNWFADEHRNLVWRSKGFAGVHDDVVLPVMSAFLNRKDPRGKGLLVHLIDSHAAYIDRYPPLPEPVGLDAEQTEQLRYRRANEHTLMILSQIATMLDELPRPAYAVYVSDHGENLLADHNGLHFHIGARTTTEVAYVPSSGNSGKSTGIPRTFDPKDSSAARSVGAVARARGRLQYLDEFRGSGGGTRADTQSKDLREDTQSPTLKARFRARISNAEDRNETDRRIVPAPTTSLRYCCAKRVCTKCSRRSISGPANPNL